MPPETPPSGGHGQPYDYVASRLVSLLDPVDRGRALRLVEINKALGVNPGCVAEYSDLVLRDRDLVEPQLLQHEGGVEDLDVNGGEKKWGWCASIPSMVDHNVP